MKYNLNQFIMKLKQTIRMVLWSLTIVLVVIGLGGCSNDDEYVDEDVYQGYIQSVNEDSDVFIIKVTSSPSDVNIEMPLKGQLLSVSLADFPDMKLKAKQKLSFNIISAEALNVFWDFSQEYVRWRCKIIIFKLD